MHRKREKFDIDFHGINITITIDEYMTVKEKDYRLDINKTIIIIITVTYIQD